LDSQKLTEKKKEFHFLCVSTAQNFTHKTNDTARRVSPRREQNRPASWEVLRKEGWVLLGKGYFPSQKPFFASFLSAQK
jgi:hypothetical protein